ncbi:two-component system, OmpR family, sensor histidine kinase MprB [Streptoalloteichus tenebrarius]|uniref:histidine kinase n=1 Tax=Streptoalloteichus tenebrarius (strain ATCC 17920 / DSM 40477 / JCM 4838 / CBS 697.72 / NBRC 16177 / NCIMB 11028 / NRRL B-12390 / A12253. 1 / ISP 5477) TaxID=1933 RepID=A0ABT1I2E0_STRSD|nr:HAMP domain-containing sensor histidine kinase [Streptoalloteichus tenebrarius]MCP2261960.1 two-component system, OmpR family, sensor histidine kinase MprB [Streptoalloteichus tenebrarius]BFF01261.1 HAMP domain-containing sensor histidine kinase [Streptoalloteichus tenebrarius]
MTVPHGAQGEAGVQTPPAARRPRRISLRTRITLLAAICVGGAVALVSLAAFLTVRNSVYGQLDESLTKRANDAAHTTLVQAEQLRAVPAALFGVSDVSVGLLQDGGRRLIYATGAEPPPVGDTEIAAARGGVPSQPRTDGRTDTRVVAVPVGPGAALVMAQPLGDARKTLERLSVVFVVVGGSGILLAAAAGTAVATAGLRPVQRLTAATERVARTGMLEPIPIAGDDELARLTHSFNAMLGALAESQERQRRLVADAGHELRTPLTSLRTNVELLIASERPGAPSLSAQDRQEIYDDVRAQLTELSTLVGDLVELAREDPPQVVHEPVDLVEVLERALDRARRRASASGITFDVRLQPWSLLGDASALERAVLNLLDNAAKWSPPEGVVRVELRQLGDGTALLQVADAGPGINEADLPHVFDRFYRSKEARTLPGSGLGLAIVKQVAERHGGTASAGRAPEGGALLSMRLPGRPA